MLTITQYLNFRFSADFEDKYSKLTLEELRDNLDRYPLLKIYKEEIQENLANKEYTLSGCVEDDPDFEMSVKEGQQLLCAAITAFKKDIEGKKVKLSSISTGVIYTPVQSLACVCSPGAINIKKVDGIHLNNNSVSKVTKDFTLHGNRMKTTEDTIFNDNNDLLKELDGRYYLTDLVVMRFDEKDLQMNLDIEGTPVSGICFYDFEFTSNKGVVNSFTFYTTECGFDPVNWITGLIHDRFKSAENELMKAEWNSTRK